MLESPLTLRTTDYHQLPREPGLLANASRLQLAWEKVQQACHCGNPQLLGEAATISAIASQQLLPKPGFDALLDRWKAQGSMVSTWRTAAASSACCWTAVGMTSNFCNGGWQTATSPPTGRSSICWRWCPGRHPAVGLRPAPGATPPAAGRFPRRCGSPRGNSGYPARVVGAAADQHMLAQQGILQVKIGSVAAQEQVVSTPGPHGQPGHLLQLRIETRSLLLQPLPWPADTPDPGE